MKGNRRFEWEWDHGDLDEGLAFDLLIWSEAENDLDRSLWRGVIKPLRETEAEVDVSGAPAVQEHGEGKYYWTVIVVQVEPYERIGQWGEFRLFTFRFQDPEDYTPTPTPVTPTPTNTKPPPGDALH